MITKNISVKAADAKLMEWASAQTKTIRLPNFSETVALALYEYREKYDPDAGKPEGS